MNGFCLQQLHPTYLYSSNDSLLKTKIKCIVSLFKRNGDPISFILNKIDKYKNEFKNQNRQFPIDSYNNTPNLKSYLTLPYIGTPSIKFSKRLAALFRDRLRTDSNNLSSFNSAIKSHRDQCKACRETMPAK